MERTKAKHLVLILARDLAANIASPMLIVDADATLVYFNEPAETVLGLSFARTGEIPISEWAEVFHLQHLDGSAYDRDHFPLAKAIFERRPAADSVRFRAADGVTRTVTVAAYPLLSRSDEYTGAVMLFWERDPV